MNAVAVILTSILDTKLESCLQGTLKTIPWTSQVQAAITALGAPPLHLPLILNILSWLPSLLISSFFCVWNSIHTSCDRRAPTANENPWGKSNSFDTLLVTSLGHRCLRVLEDSQRLVPCQRAGAVCGADLALLPAWVPFSFLLCKGFHGVAWDAGSSLWSKYYWACCVCFKSYFSCWKPARTPEPPPISVFLAWQKNSQN